jgi:hypothetical protein
MNARTTADPHCSFCNKKQMDVLTLIAGPTARICNECIDICNDIVRGLTGSEVGGLEVFQSRHSGPLVRCRFCMAVFPEDKTLVIADRARLCTACVDIMRQHLGREKG